jgi:[ribosomal protein S5]-alanine N-acetyltransferase
VNASGTGLIQQLPIRTRRLLIRPFRLDDADALYELHRSEEVTRYAGGIKTRSESLRALYRIIERVASTGFGALALEELQGGEVIGWCGIQRMRDIKEFEVVYALRTHKWGNGLAYEAASAVIASAFESEAPKISRICGLVFPQNSRSIGVLERLGMHFVRYHYDQSTSKRACLYMTSRKQFANQLSSSSK